MRGSFMSYGSAIAYGQSRKAPRLPSYSFDSIGSTLSQRTGMPSGCSQLDMIAIDLTSFSAVMSISRPSDSALQHQYISIFASWAVRDGSQSGEKDSNVAEQD